MASDGRIRRNEMKSIIAAFSLGGAGGSIGMQGILSGSVGLIIGGVMLTLAGCVVGYALGGK